MSHSPNNSQDQWECLSNPFIVCKRMGDGWYTIQSTQDIKEAVMVLNNSLSSDLKLFNKVDPENYNIFMVNSYDPEIEEFELECQALEHCVDVYEQYTKEEVNNLHTSIVQCWEVGRRAIKN